MRDEMNNSYIDEEVKMKEKATSEKRSLLPKELKYLEDQNTERLGLENKYDAALVMLKNERDREIAENQARWVKKAAEECNDIIEGNTNNEPRDLFGNTKKDWDDFLEKYDRVMGSV
jgi:hypothetical protein